MFCHAFTFLGKLDGTYGLERGMKESGMLACKSFITVQEENHSSSPKRQNRRQFFLTNYLIFARNNDVMLTGV